MAAESINDNNNNPRGMMINSHIILTRPVAVSRSPVKVQFSTVPTIQELEKGISPPGSTPRSSSTNIHVSTATTSNGVTPMTPKMIHSSTSLEAQFDDDSSEPSTCNSVTNTEAITKLKAQRGHPHQRVKRGTYFRRTRTVSTEPHKSMGTDGKTRTTVSIQAGTGSVKRSAILPSKSILRKPILPMKDSNSNIITKTATVSVGSSTCTVHASNGSEQLTDDEEETNVKIPVNKSEMWGTVMKTNSSQVNLPLTTQRSSHPRRNYITPHTRSSMSTSSSAYSTGPQQRYEETASGLSFGGSSEMLMSLRTKGEESRKAQLPQLSSVIEELKRKEVVFDRATAIHGLKARILRGEKVTHEEIKAIRNMTLPPHERHLGYRLPWSTDLYCDKGLVYVVTQCKPAPEKNTFGTIEDLRIPFENEFTMEHYGRRQYILNLAGFRDDHISLYLEGKNRLVLRAVRYDALDEVDNMTPNTVTETILLPPDLPADNLRIVRKPSGTTIIEESWRF